MPYFQGIRTIFSHIPKTAGESVVETLEAYSEENNLGRIITTRKHETMLDLFYHTAQNDMRNEFRDAFKFSIVRNPWDRIHSWFHYNQNMWETMPDGFPPDATTFTDEVPPCEYDCKDRFLSMDFNLWVKNITVYGDDSSKDRFCKSTICPFHQIAPQYLFVVDNSGFFLINDFLRFEDLNLWSDFVSERMSIVPPPELVFKNKGPSSRSYVDSYDKSSIDIIRNMYATDIRFFGYDFK